jgi:hypothetical protein
MARTTTVVTQADLNVVNQRLGALEAKVFGVLTPQPPPPLPVPPPAPPPTPAPVPAPTPIPTSSVVYVGPTRGLGTIRAGFNALGPAGGTIVVDPATYYETFALTKNCSIICSNGRAVVRVPPGVMPVYGKSILHCAAPQITFVNLDFADAQAWQGDASVAAVCTEPNVQSLVMNGVNIYNCSQGLRSIDGDGADPERVYPVISMADCSIHDCGPPSLSASDPLCHNVYTMHGGSLTATRCTFAPHKYGHSLKSRMRATTLVDCVLSSRHARCVDVPDGGTFRITNGSLIKPAGADQHEFLGWSYESAIHPYGPVELRMVKFINDTGGPTAIAHGPFNAAVPINVIAPIFSGPAPTFQGLVVKS